MELSICVFACLPLGVEFGFEIRSIDREAMTVAVAVVAAVRQNSPYFDDDEYLAGHRYDRRRIYRPSYSK